MAQISRQTEAAPKKETIKELDGQIRRLDRQIKKMGGYKATFLSRIRGGGIFDAMVDALSGTLAAREQRKLEGQKESLEETRRSLRAAMDIGESSRRAPRPGELPVYNVAVREGRRTTHYKAVTNEEKAKLEERFPGKVEIEEEVFMPAGLVRRRAL